MLREDYLKTPRTEQAWKEVGDEFRDLWQFPQCLGALDGKHVKIVPPSGSGSLFFNYKGTFSIVLMALVDAQLNFLYVDAGTNGKMSDGGVWAKCGFKEALESRRLNIPPPTNLPASNIQFPYVIVADDAFPLCSYMMKPYPGQEIGQAQRIFNYRLSRARRVVENAFGLLAARFQVYGKPINTSPVNAVHIVMATCVLHNFLRKRNPPLYMPPKSIDVEDIVKKTISRGDWRNEPSDAFLELEKEKKRGSQASKNLRNVLMNYFNQTGSVSWQKDMCLLH